MARGYHQTYDNLDTVSEFQTLKKEHPPYERMTKQQLLSQVVTASNLSLFYAGSGLSDTSLKAWATIVKKAHILDRFASVLDGQPVNKTESRAVSHHKTRVPQSNPYTQEFDRVQTFVTKVHSGTVVSASGKPFKRVVQLGIGGSYLGPKAMIDALKPWAKTHQVCTMDAGFISNIDPSEFCDMTPDIFSETLWVVVSKSGSTLETARNLALLTAFADRFHAPLAKQLILVTQKGSQLDQQPCLERFYIDEAIGGRYSATSAVGMLIVSLAYLPSVATAILEGAHRMDNNGLEQDLGKNLALLNAVIGVHHRNICNMPTKAIVPYAQPLASFVEHLQQTDCESNGKHVSVNGDSIDYQTGPLIFGSPGTNAQHSYFQKLHQGSDICPIQFIGFQESAFASVDPTIQSVIQDNHRLLNENLASQYAALCMGQPSEDKRRHFEGNRPCTLLMGPVLDPQTFGELFAFYENTIMFQGFIWNINSFDQEGVELGKQLAKQLQKSRSTSPDGVDQNDELNKAAHDSVTVHDIYQRFFNS